MKKFFGFISVLTLLIIISGCGSENDTSKASNSSKVANESSISKESSSANDSSLKNETNGNFVSKASDAYFDGTILKGNSYSIKITSHKVIQPGEKGNEHGEKPVLAIWYDTMVSPSYNDSNAINANNAWILNFNAVQDNDPNKVNKLSITSLPDEQFLDSQTAEIKPGGTVANAVAYELSDDTTPVVVSAETIIGNKLGETTINIK